MIKEAWIRMLASMKFWTMVLGLILTPCSALLAKHGFEVSDENVRLIAELVAGGFAILLGMQGLADHGKEAARLKGSSIEGVGGNVTVVTAAPASKPEDMPPPPPAPMEPPVVMP